MLFRAALFRLPVFLMQLLLKTETFTAPFITVLSHSKQNHNWVVLTFFPLFSAVGSGVFFAQRDCDNNECNNMAYAQDMRADANREI